MAKQVAVIGATGKVAKHAIEYALNMGYQVKALARHPENIGIEHEKLTTFQGDVLVPESLGPAIEGVDMVLSCIGNRSKDKGVWVIERGTQNIIDVMKEKSVGRLAIISSVGVGDSRKQLGMMGFRGWIFGALFFTVMNKSRKDLLGAEQAALNSGLQVVVIRPTELTREPGKGTWRATDHNGKVGAKISREDVGHFMATLVENREYDGTAVTLGS